jgi:hypothetical protein
MPFEHSVKDLEARNLTEKKVANDLFIYNPFEKKSGEAHKVCIGPVLRHICLTALANFGDFGVWLTRRTW